MFSVFGQNTQICTQLRHYAGEISRLGLGLERFTKSSIPDLGLEPQKAIVQLHARTLNFGIPVVRLMRWCSNFKVKKITGAILIFG